MISTIYIEQAIADHPRLTSLLERYPKAAQVSCERYGEVFNRKAQNFRLQKLKPSLIAARKHQGRLLPSPPEYRIGEGAGYYFSHLLNCLYDCRYCFLQGMYRSAHYVWFLNYEEFAQDIRELVAQGPSWFYSGYDCDSLALDPVTGFADFALDLFADLPAHARLELRTKSTQIRSLLAREPLQNVVTAFSFTPAAVGNALELKVPAIEKRVAAMVKLQQAGWPVGLRLDPLIYTRDYEEQYRQLFKTLFESVDQPLNADALHSVSLGAFRLPKGYFESMRKLYPQEVLFAGPLETRGGMVSYQPELEQQMVERVEALLLDYIPAEAYFPCPLPEST
ncbi:MAG: DNA photolyase [Gammaproteobacteria bacterium]|nr:MAG: DNA photolyase [Gammaproteobacteria bacterium]